MKFHIIINATVLCSLFSVATAQAQHQVLTLAEARAKALEQNKENLPETVLPDMIPSLDPISMDIELHYSGKTGPNAPTTLNINAQIIKGDLNVSIEGKIKTASTWPFVPFSAENAVQLISLKDEAASGYIREWIANATTGIKRLEESTDTGIQTVEGE